MKVLDLFSGIGGFSLGLECAGWETVAFCEIEPSCHNVLSKYWPDVPIFEDVTKLSATDIASSVDVICGGFPCQDISVAGKKKGITGNRSGLWKEYLRLINEIRPKYAIIENVANLRSHGLITVLQDLWQIGYNAQWHCISASALGAPHQRDRIWIIAYPDRQRCECGRDNWEERPVQNDQKRYDSKIHQERSQRQSGSGQICEILANANGESKSGLPIGAQEKFSLSGNNGQAGDMADSHSSRKVGITGTDCTAPQKCRGRRINAGGSRADDRGDDKSSSHEELANTNCEGLQGYRQAGCFSQILTQEAVGMFRGTRGNQWWGLEPDIPRLADGKLNPDWVEWLMGFPIGWTEGLKRKQRLVGLGNALVPIIPEMIATCINEHKNTSCPSHLIRYRPSLNCSI